MRPRRDLIDPETHAPGAGMVIPRNVACDHGEGEPVSHDIAFQPGKVSVARRAELFGQAPLTLWLTGLSGSGKTTLAQTLEQRLIAAGRPCYVLDGDNLRHGLSRDLGFSPEDRRENIRRVAEVARLMNDAGLFVITAFISPYREDRAMARRIVGEGRFVEVHLSAPLAACEARDPKGLYRKARRGEIAGFTGVDAPYEVPEAPDLAIDTGALSIERSIEQLLAFASRRIALR